MTKTRAVHFSRSDGRPGCRKGARRSFFPSPCAQSSSIHSHCPAPLATAALSRDWPAVLRLSPDRLLQRARPSSTVGDEARGAPPKAWPLLAVLPQAPAARLLLLAPGTRDWRGELCCPGPLSRAFVDETGRRAVARGRRACCCAGDGAPLRRAPPYWATFFQLVLPLINEPRDQSRVKSL